MPKNIPLGDDIPEQEEWIKPFKNEGDPDTVQDEQVWANTKHHFVFNALPITDARPYKEQDKHQNEREQRASNVIGTNAASQTKTSATKISSDYRIPRKSFQSAKINELVNDFNSSRALPASRIAHPATEREKEHREKAKKDRRKSSKPVSQRHPESEPDVTDNDTVTSKVKPKPRPQPSTPDHSKAPKKNDSAEFPGKESRASKPTSNNTELPKGVSKTEVPTKEDASKSKNKEAQNNKNKGVPNTKKESEQDAKKKGSDSNRSRKPRRD